MFLRLAFYFKNNEEIFGVVVFCGTFATMKENNRSTESVRIEMGVLHLARQAKAHTGISISAFITKAIVREFNRLPKSVKDKIHAES
jgi:hypothetical protein